MEISGIIKTKVEVDPIRVIQRLIINEIGQNSIYTEDRGYYILLNQLDERYPETKSIPITKDRYELVRKLQDIERYLEQGKPYIPKQGKPNN